MPKIHVCSNPCESCAACTALYNCSEPEWTCVCSVYACSNEPWRMCLLCFKRIFRVHVMCCVQIAVTGAAPLNWISIFWALGVPQTLLCSRACFQFIQTDFQRCDLCCVLRRRWWACFSLWVMIMVFMCYSLSCSGNAGVSAEIRAELQRAALHHPPGQGKDSLQTAGVNVLPEQTAPLNTVKHSAPIQTQVLSGSVVSEGLSRERTSWTQHWHVGPDEPPAAKPSKISNESKF